MHVSEERNDLRHVMQNYWAIMKYERKQVALANLESRGTKELMKIENKVGQLKDDLQPQTRYL